MKRKGKIGLIIGLVVFLLILVFSIVAVAVAMSKVKDMQAIILRRLLICRLSAVRWV